MWVRIFFNVAALVCCCKGVMGYSHKTVEIEELLVPESPCAGQDVSLTCRFHLRGHNHRLYTVNWWRGKDQFYTYKGTSPDPKHAYTFRGIHVKADESTEETVVLRNVSEDTSGVFKCEVMGEGPSFRTAVATKPMQVVVPPSSVEIRSRVVRDPPVYHVGERVHLNCTATGAKPRAVLTWDINGTPVRNSEVKQVPDYEDHSGRVTSTLTLTWDPPTYFTNNLARVTCSAAVSGHITSASKDLFLNPASSAAYNHQYASAGCQLSTTWTILSLASLLVARRVP